MPKLIFQIRKNLHVFWFLYFIFFFSARGPGAQRTFRLSSFIPYINFTFYFNKKKPKNMQTFSYLKNQFRHMS